MTGTAASMPFRSAQVGKIEMNDLELYLRELTDKVCRDLASMYSRAMHSSSHGLVFPRKRDGTLRISEQEAKLLFIQHLTVDKRYCFCVETPTTETYVQKGTTPMSARVDLTLLGNDSRPVAHIEQKAHNCELESIRKDLEKLLRERSTGCWFHTLERADRDTIQALLGKFRAAFGMLPDCLAQSRASYLFAFFVLSSSRLTYQWVRFDGDSAHNISAIDTAFREGGADSGWQMLSFRLEGDGKETECASSSSVGKGRREGYFVLAPSLASETFLHLSVRGGRYRIRGYNLENPVERPEIFRIGGCSTFEDLRASGVITRFVPVTAVDLHHNIDDEPAYWCNRIRALNHQLLGTPGA